MDTQHSVAAHKRALRRALLSDMQAIPPHVKLASDEQIRLRLRAMPQYQQASSLFVFVGSGWEVDTWPIIEDALAAGKVVAVPRCIPKPGGAHISTGSSEGIMEACIIHGLSELVLSSDMGLWEPAKGTPVLAPSHIEFALIPCMTCDRSGHRLGRGGGYYDRFLSGASFLKAAVCREGLLQDALPLEAHDEAVDFIITETALYECSH